VETLIVGDGGLGRAIAAACRERGHPAPHVLGRPAGGRHNVASLRPVDVAFEATTGSAVLANVEAILAAGCRRLVIGTTAWEADRGGVDGLLRRSGAAAVAASNLSLACALFVRVVEDAAARFAALGGFDPYIVEWHRRTKQDRPSGTAGELARRMADVSARVPEISSVRAGANPGTHLVGFDGPGEAVEIRLVARDRVAYADGALAAAAWLMAAARRPGLHSFEEVVDDLLAAGPAERAGQVAMAS